MKKVIQTLLFTLVLLAGLAACTPASDSASSQSASLKEASAAASTSLEGAASEAGSAISSNIASSVHEELEKQQANLGFLEDANSNLVLLLNTEVDITTVRNSLRSYMENSARDQLILFHQLLDSHRFYNDASGNQIANIAYLNERIGEGPVKVDPALLGVISEAIDMAELTQGYFNPTIGKVVDVYDGKFSAKGEVQENPSTEDVQTALQSVVPHDRLREYVVVDAAESTVELLPFEGQRYRLTLSAIGKGYALDALQFEHDTSYLITAGASSIRTYVAEDEPEISWNVATRVPDGTDLLLAFGMDEGSVSVSGDDENYYLLEDGTRVHHILNPFTGYSENYYRTIILTGENAGVLDALSTALFNIGDSEQVAQIISRVEEHYGIHIDYCLVSQQGGEGSYHLLGSAGFQEAMIPEYTNSAVDPNMEILDKS